MRKLRSENFYENAIVCMDLNGLIDRIIEDRNIDEDDMLIRIGMDGGHGFMKICVSVFDFNSNDDDLEYGEREGERFKDSVS